MHFSRPNESLIICNSDILSNEVLFGLNYVDMTTQSNHELRMSSPGSHLSVFKMADGGRFDSFYFNCRKIRDFSRLKAKDKSKVRKGRVHRSFPSCNATNDDLPWPASEDDASLVNEEDLDPPVGVDEQPLCTAVPQDHSSSMDHESVIREYGLLLCRFEAVTMIDYQRFCLPQFCSSQHKLSVSFERKTFYYPEICQSLFKMRV